MTDNGIGCDLVCAGSPPLHMVPIFTYIQPRRPQGSSHQRVPSPSHAAAAAAANNNNHANAAAAAYCPFVGSLGTPEGALPPPSTAPPALPSPSARASSDSYVVPHWILVSFTDPPPPPPLAAARITRAPFTQPEALVVPLGMPSLQPPPGLPRGCGESSSSSPLTAASSALGGAVGGATPPLGPLCEARCSPSGSISPSDLSGAAGAGGYTGGGTGDAPAVPPALHSSEDSSGAGLAGLFVQESVSEESVLSEQSAEAAGADGNDGTVFASGFGDDGALFASGLGGAADSTCDGGGEVRGAVDEASLRRAAAAHDSAVFGVRRPLLSRPARPPHADDPLPELANSLAGAASLGAGTGSYLPHCGSPLAANSPRPRATSPLLRATPRGYLPPSLDLPVSIGGVAEPLALAAPTSRSQAIPTRGGPPAYLLPGAHVHSGAYYRPWLDSSAMGAGFGRCAPDANVRRQEKASSSDSRFRRKLSGTTDIVFWERRDRRCCVWQNGSGSVYLQSLWPNSPPAILNSVLG